MLPGARICIHGQLEGLPLSLRGSRTCPLRAGFHHFVLVRQQWRIPVKDGKVISDVLELMDSVVEDVNGRFGVRLQ